MSDLHRTIDNLAHAAVHGDHAAVALLVRLGNQIATHLQCLASAPLETPGRQAADAAAATAEGWPLVCPAIEEHRQSCLQNIPAGLGSAAPIRIQKGRTKLRDFSYHSQSGFALHVFGFLDRERRSAADDYRNSLKDNWHHLTEEQRNDWRILAALLPELVNSAACITKWKEAGTRWAEAACGGQWKTYPWPAEVKSRAEQRTNSRKRGVETAVKEYLGKGFGSIAHPLPLI